jgi:hypothetical protein
MKILLCAFEQLSGLKLIFIRVKCFVMGRLRTIQTNIHVTLVVVWVSTLSGTYPFHCTIENLVTGIGKPWKNAFKKLSSWKGKILSYGGRLVLINSVLSSLAMYMMSFFEVPKGILKKLDLY